MKYDTKHKALIQPLFVDLKKIYFKYYLKIQ